MNTIDESTQKKIITVLSALFPNAKIILFGSRARGTASEWSDIDLALDAQEKIDFIDIGEARDVLSALNIPYKIDIVDFQSVSPEMKKLIKDGGIIWKS